MNRVLVIEKAADGFETIVYGATGPLRMLKAEGERLMRGYSNRRYVIERTGV